jgi:hypothetical protein
MAVLFELLSKDGKAQVDERKSEIEGHRLQRKKELDDHKAALERAKKAQSDQGSGFFGSIGKIVSDVVDDAVHLRVADCVTDAKDDLEAAWNSPHFWHDLESGAGSIFKAVNTAFALVAALACLQGDDAVDIVKNPDSASARHWAFAGKAALVLSAGVASAVTAGVATPAVIAGVSVALSAGGEAVMETHCLGGASDYVGFGLEAGGAVAGAFPAPATKVDQAVKAFMAAERLIEGAARAVEGLAHARSANFEGDAQDAMADAKAAQHRLERIDRLIKQLLTETKDVQKSHERALGAIREAIETNNQTLLVAAGVKG